MVSNTQRILRVGLCALVGGVMLMPADSDTSIAHGAKSAREVVSPLSIRAKRKVVSAAEWMTYGVYFGPLRVGRAKLAVGRTRGASKGGSFSMRGRAEASKGIPGWAGYAEEQTTTVDARRLLPLKSTLRTQRSGKDKTTVTRHNSVKAGLTRQTITRQGQSRSHRRTHRLPTGYFDLLSAIAALRETRLVKGQRQQITVLMGTKVYRVDLQGRGTEKIIVAGERHESVRIDGVARRTTDRGTLLRRKKPMKLSVWLSGDSRRVPLRLRVATTLGAVRVQLDGYRAPGTSAASVARR